MQVPLIGFIGRLDYQKGADLVLGAAHWLLNQDVQIVCLGTGDKHLEVILFSTPHSANTWAFECLQTELLTGTLSYFATACLHTHQRIQIHVGCPVAIAIMVSKRHIGLRTIVFPDTALSFGLSALYIMGHTNYFSAGWGQRLVPVLAGRHAMAGERISRQSPRLGGLQRAHESQDHSGL